MNRLEQFKQEYEQLGTYVKQVLNERPDVRDEILKSLSNLTCLLFEELLASKQDEMLRQKEYLEILMNFNGTLEELLMSTRIHPGLRKGGMTN